MEILQALEGLKSIADLMVIGGGILSIIASVGLGIACVIWGWLN